VIGRNPLEYGEGLLLIMNSSLSSVVSSVAVKLPDGAVRECPAGSTPFDVANSISPRLAAASVVAKIRPLHAAAPATTESGEGASDEAEMYSASHPAAERLVDLHARLTEDVELQLLRENDAEALKVLRHSAAHVMATAVLELFPETKLGHGPATDAGFFYDFYRPTPFTPDDLKAIEAKMAEVVAHDQRFIHEYESRDEDISAFSNC
jgi:threonyl-tRNA synthetase